MYVKPGNVDKPFLVCRTLLRSALSALEKQIGYTEYDDGSKHILNSQIFEVDLSTYVEDHIDDFIEIKFKLKNVSMFMHLSMPSVLKRGMPLKVEPVKKPVPSP